MSKLNNRIFIVYDIPWEECDKPWLYEGLYAQYGNRVIRMDPKYNLFKLSQMGAKGKIKRYLTNAKMIFKVSRESKKNDIIICWHPYVGLFMKLVCRKKTVLALNWLTPKRNLFKKLKQYCFNQDGFYASVNIKESIELWIKALNLKNGNSFFYLPDVAANTDEQPINITLNDKYFFTGGINNRDWKLIMTLAQRKRNWKFICCAKEDDFKGILNSVDFVEIPPNIEVHFDVASDEYYSYMKNAFLVLLPLKENRVSGLINVLKANEYGKLCISSNIPGISAYYHGNLSDLLISIGDVDAFEAKVSEILDYDEETYVKKVKEMRKHQKDNFSQGKAINCILNLVRLYADIDKGVSL